MPEVSAVLIAQNESARIERAVASVLPWVAEVLVVDGGSVDETPALARAAGARVLSRPFDGHITQKQAAAEAASHDFVFSLDADELVDEELGQALLALSRADDPPDLAAWAVRRRNYLDGRALRASGWYPDRRLRLFDRRRACWGGYEPHDLLEAHGPTGGLPGHIHHDPDRTLQTYLAATRRHAERRARSLIASGKPPGPLAAGSHALWHFASKLLLRCAWLDGSRGLRIAWVGALGVWWKYRAARELKR